MKPFRNVTMTTGVNNGLSSAHTRASLTRGETKRKNNNNGTDV